MCSMHSLNLLAWLDRMSVFLDVPGITCAMKSEIRPTAHELEDGGLQSH